MNPLLGVTIAILVVSTPILGGAFVHRVDRKRRELDGLPPVDEKPNPVRHRKGKPS